MSSLKQQEANRLNAQKSTGPRTAEGKAAVRFNALQSGIDAQSEVIPGEDQTRLEALVSLYQERWNPQTPESQSLVDVCVHSDWLLRRLRRAEASYWKYCAIETDSQVRDKHDPEGRVLTFAEDTLGRVQRRLNAIQRNLQSAIRDLARLKAAEREEEAAQSEAEPEFGAEPEVGAATVRERAEGETARQAAPPQIQPQSAQSPDPQNGFVPPLSENAPAAIPPQSEITLNTRAKDTQIA